MNFDDTARYFGPSDKLWPGLFNAASPEAQEEESRRIFHSERDQAWGNRKVGSQTPVDYLEKEEAAWLRHLDRPKLIAKGRLAKWSLCRNCGTEKLSAGKRFCTRCKLKLRRQRRRKCSSDMAQSGDVNGSTPRGEK
jgi:hypothetical protein